MSDEGSGLSRRLQELRQRADEDFGDPSVTRSPGRHQLDIDELGLRVSLTRSLYPNRPGGVDQYAVTISRRQLDHIPAEPETRAVLEAAFGDEAAGRAVERPSGSLIRMFRVPAALS